MRPYLKAFASATLLFLSLGLWAEGYHLQDPDLLVRLAYHNSGLLERDALGHVCVAVYRDRGFRVVRTQNGLNRWLEGRMSKEQFQQLRTLLGSADFQALSSRPGGMIRQDAESFIAEIPILGGTLAEDKSHRLQWLNADGENPFPSPVARVVNWLKAFQPTQGIQFEPTEFPDVCPSGELRWLQPTVAQNTHP